LAALSSGTKDVSNSTRFCAMDFDWSRPTKPVTAEMPSSAAVSITRSMKSCFFCRICGSSCSMSSK
jgi:heterodisulfide reductase subunit C